MLVRCSRSTMKWKLNSRTSIVRAARLLYRSRPKKFTKKTKPCKAIAPANLLRLVRAWAICSRNTSAARKPRNCQSGVRGGVHHRRALADGESSLLCNNNNGPEHDEVGTH